MVGLWGGRGSLGSTMNDNGLQKNDKNASLPRICVENRLRTKFLIRTLGQRGSTLFQSTLHYRKKLKQ